MKIKGLYAITPDTEDTTRLIHQVQLALPHGVQFLQYRNKSKNRTLRLTQAKNLHQLCQIYSIPLIINDDVELAGQINAEGVHLGSDDATLQDARAKLGSKKIIGISCYDQIHLALQAQADGADYVAFGAIFNSATKPNAVHASLNLLHEARRQLSCSIVAIGGITAENAHLPIAAGADSVAVISALFDGENIQQSAKRLAESFNNMIY